MIGRVTSDPPTVEVAGPESRLKQLTGATTEPVQVTGSRARVRDVVTVGMTDSAVRLVQPQNATITVEVLPAPGRARSARACRSGGAICSPG